MLTQSFSAGICAGDAPFVCDNLIFRTMLLLKHVGDCENLISELVGKISGVGQVFSMWTKQDNAFNYKEGKRKHRGTRPYHCAYSAINLQKIPDVLNQWDLVTTVSLEQERKLLYNAFTEVYKGNLFINSNPSTLVSWVWRASLCTWPFVGLNYGEERLRKSHKPR